MPILQALLLGMLIDNCILLIGNSKSDQSPVHTLNQTANLILNQNLNQNLNRPIIALAEEISLDLGKFP